MNFEMLLTCGTLLVEDGMCVARLVHSLSTAVEVVVP